MHQTLCLPQHFRVYIYNKRPLSTILSTINLQNKYQLVANDQHDMLTQMQLIGIN